MKNKYIYNATLNYVHDGDTINVDFDLGFGIFFKNQNVRLYGINAPELKGITKESAILSKQRLTQLLDGQNIIIETLKDKKGKYGRWLGKIYVNDSLINDILINENLAIPYL